MATTGTSHRAGADGIFVIQMYGLPIRGRTTGCSTPARLANPRGLELGELASISGGNHGERQNGACCV